MTDNNADVPKSANVKAMNIHQRIHHAQQHVRYVQKDKKNGMQYSVVSHDKVTALVRPPLLDARITYQPVEMAVAQNGNRTEVVLKVRFTNIDDPKDYIDVPSFGYGIDSQDKGPGKAISYAVKYALLKALALETGDDPDQDQDVEFKPDHVTPEQAAELEALATEVGANIPNFLKYCKAESFETLPADKYAQAVSALEAKRAAA